MGAASGFIVYLLRAVLNALIGHFVRLICFYKIFGGLHIFFTADSCKITEAKQAAHLHHGLQWKFASARAALAAKSVSENFCRIAEAVVMEQPTKRLNF